MSYANTEALYNNNNNSRISIPPSVVTSEAVRLNLKLWIILRKEVSSFFSITYLYLYLCTAMDFSMRAFNVHIQ